MGRGVVRGWGWVVVVAAVVAFVVEVVIVFPVFVIFAVVFGIRCGEHGLDLAGDFGLESGGARGGGDRGAGWCGGRVRCRRRGRRIEGTVAGGVRRLLGSGRAGAGIEGSDDVGGGAAFFDGVFGGGDELFERGEGEGLFEVGEVGSVGGDVGGDGRGGEPVVEVGEVGGAHARDGVFREAVDQGVEVFRTEDVAEEERAAQGGEMGQGLELGDHGVEGSGFIWECKRGRGKVEGVSDMTLSAGLYLI